MTWSTKSRAKRAWKNTRRTPLGRRVMHLVRAEGKAPAKDTLAWLAATGTDDVQALERALREAMCQRDAETSALLASPIRDLESPHARRVLAVWLCVAEMTRHHLANSRSLWLGHDETGKAGGIAGRVGVCRRTVGRMLDALEAAGALKRWQAPKDTAGIVRGKHGYAYNSYLVRVLPKNLARQVRAFWVAQKQQTELPEPTEAPVCPAAPEPPSSPPEPAPGPSVEPLNDDDMAALADLQLTCSALAAAHDRERALATYGPFFPSGPPGRA